MRSRSENFELRRWSDMYKSDFRGESVGSNWIYRGVNATKLKKKTSLFRQANKDIFHVLYTCTYVILAESPVPGRRRAPN